MGFEVIDSNRSALMFYCYPGGNPTYIAYAPSIAPDQYTIADREIKRKYNSLEQGGFLQKSESGRAAIRLQMSGGEFCGNAARAAAAVFASDYRYGKALAGIANYELVTAIQTGIQFPIEISGTASLLEAFVTCGRSDYEVRVEMPLDLHQTLTEHTIEIHGQSLSVLLIAMEGISHVLIPAVKFEFKKDTGWQAEIAARIRAQLNLNSLKAVGFIWYSKAVDIPQLGLVARIEPVVWVNSLGSCLYESSCGSASMALAIAYKQKVTLNNRNGLVMQIRQPSGFFIKTQIVSDESSGLEKVSIKGQVQIVTEQREEMLFSKSSAEFSSGSKILALEQAWPK